MKREMIKENDSDRAYYIVEQTTIKCGREKRRERRAKNRKQLSPCDF
jgi:hypothetical protein